MLRKMGSDPETVARIESKTDLESKTVNSRMVETESKLSLMKNVKLPTTLVQQDDDLKCLTKE